MDAKVWWQSKTVWFNIVTIALAILGFLMVTQAAGGLPFDIDSRWLVLVSGIGNIILRFLTNQPLTTKKIDGNVIALLVFVAALTMFVLSASAPQGYGG
jgi:hypothetical protein